MSGTQQSGPDNVRRKYLGHHCGHLGDFDEALRGATIHLDTPLPQC